MLVELLYHVGYYVHMLVGVYASRDSTYCFELRCVVFARLLSRPADTIP